MKKSNICKYLYLGTAIVSLQISLLATANAASFTIVNNTGVPIMATVTTKEAYGTPGYDLKNIALANQQRSKQGQVPLLEVGSSNHWTISFTTSQYNYNGTIVTMNENKTFQENKSCEIFSEDASVEVLINRNNYVIKPSSSSSCDGLFEGATAVPFYVQNQTGEPITVSVNVMKESNKWASQSISNQYLDTQNQDSPPGLVPVAIGTISINQWKISYTDAQKRKYVAWGGDGPFKMCEIRADDTRVTIYIRKDPGTNETRFVIAPNNSRNCSGIFKLESNDS
jgi:hypothetical protein